MRTQFNIRLPEEHVRRLDAMRQARGGLSQSEMVMSLIDTEQGRRDGRAKKGSLVIYPDARMAAVAGEMNPYALDDLETAIHARRLELAADELRARGMPVLTKLPDRDGAFGYLLVLAPHYLSAFTETERQAIPPNVLADAAEARHLLDYLRELPPVEAYRRWHCTAAPLTEELQSRWWYSSFMDLHSAHIALNRVNEEIRRAYYSDEPVDAARDHALQTEEMSLADMIRDVTGAMSR